VGDPSRRRIRLATAKSLVGPEARWIIAKNHHLNHSSKRASKTVCWSVSGVVVVRLAGKGLRVHRLFDRAATAKQSKSR